MSGSADQNPWLSIPAADYDGHMSSPEVRQSQYLAEVVRELIEEHAPDTLAVLGCATGNGFDVIPRETSRVLGVDLNRDYLGILRRRYGRRITSLELICADLADLDPSLQALRDSFELIHCALIFEYVELSRVLPAVVPWLRRSGRLSVVLQLPAEGAGAVTKTAYPSLRTLEPIMTLVAPEDLEAAADRVGLSLESSRIDELESGKQFYFSVFSRE